MKIIEIYLLLMNLLGILLTASDKKRAQDGVWRIRERTLWGISILGGSVGTYAAMRLFHHKTRHRRFMIGLPLLILAQGIVCFAAWRWGWFPPALAAN